MNRELAYFKQLFFKNIQLLFLSFIVFLIAFSNVIVFLALGTILILILIIVVVLVMMDYQYRRYSIDFYYALPITRIKMFWIHAITALLYLLIPCIAAICILFPMYIHTYFFKELIFVVPILTTSVFALIAITAFSNSRVDSVLLCLLYPIIVMVIFTSLYTLLSSHYLYGLDIGTLALLDYIRVFFTLTSASILNFPKQLLVYSIGFIFQIATWILISNYFVKRRKVEHAGVGNLELRRYQYVRVIATFVMFLGFAAVYYGHYSNVSQFVIRNVKDYFQFMLHYIKVQFGNILLGFIFYLIVSVIVQRKVDKILKHIVHYCLILISFLFIFSSATVVKKIVFEDKMPSQISRIKFRYEYEYLKDDFLPRIISYKNHKIIPEEFTFESEEVKAETVKLHQSLLNNRVYNIEVGTRLEIIYNPNSPLKLKRAYHVRESDLHAFAKVLMDPKGEFGNRIFTLVNKSNNTAFSYKNKSKKIKIEEKEKLNRFIEHYLTHFKPNAQNGRYAARDIAVLDVGDYKIEFTVYNHSDLELEIERLFSSLE